MKFITYKSMRPNKHPFSILVFLSLIFNFAGAQTFTGSNADDLFTNSFVAPTQNAGLSLLEATSPVDTIGATQLDLKREFSPIDDLSSLRSSSSIELPRSFPNASQSTLFASRSFADSASFGVPFLVSNPFTSNAFVFSDINTLRFKRISRFLASTQVSSTSSSVPETSTYTLLVGIFALLYITVRR